MMTFTLVFCAERFGLGQPGRLPASMNAMRVLSTSTDLETAVADALVRGKAQHVTNSRKLLEVAFCTYIFLFLILCVFLLNEPICIHVTLPKSFFRVWEDVRKGGFNA